MKKIIPHSYWIDFVTEDDPTVDTTMYVEWKVYPETYLNQCLLSRSNCCASKRYNRVLSLEWLNSNSYLNQKIHWLFHTLTLNIETLVYFFEPRVIECGMVCNTREGCNIFKMEGQTCTFGQTFWSPQVVTSGLEVYVEHNRKNKTYYHWMKANWPSDISTIKKAAFSVCVS